MPVHGDPDPVAAGGDRVVAVEAAVEAGEVEVTEAVAPELVGDLVLRDQPIPRIAVRPAMIPPVVLVPATVLGPTAAARR